VRRTLFGYVAIKEINFEILLAARMLADLFSGNFS